MSSLLFINSYSRWSLINTLENVVLLSQVPPSLAGPCCSTNLHSCLTAAMLMEWKGWRALRRTLSTCWQIWRDSRVNGVVTRQKAARVFTAALPTPLTASSDDGLSVPATGWSKMPCASAKCRTSCPFARNSCTQPGFVLGFWEKV